MNHVFMRRAAVLAFTFVAACATSKQTSTTTQAASSAAAETRPKAAEDRLAELVDVQAINPNIRIDLRYATPNNFTKQQLYSSGKRCFLRRSAAQKLDSVQRELETIGLGLKIYDGYRPLSVQKKMWAIMPDENYVANPVKGSRHNRGAAVDLTLVRPDGTELLMPTPFDDFTDKAGHDTTQGIPEEALRNRATLKRVMEKHGFKALASEWWHYDEEGWQRYDILDIDSVFTK